MSPPRQKKNATRPGQDTDFKLKERVKELNCLYTISKLGENTEIDIDGLMNRVVDLLAPGFQYPDITRVSAAIEGKTYGRQPLQKGNRVLVSPIETGTGKTGSLQVWYAEKKPCLDEGPFMKEERYLIDTVAKSIAKIIDRIRLTRELREIEARQKTIRLQKENISLKPSLAKGGGFQNIIGKSRVMEQVYAEVLDAAHANANVSIFGESGTGKELVAKAIHDLSPRRAKGFIPVNCGAIPELLFESEFFGYKKGAFTGAVIDKHGYLDLAHQGTLFLDEIGELQGHMQAKLLRALDGGGYHPIGSNKRFNSDVRIIAATNRDLRSQVLTGDMRVDFFYRIHVIPITLPPLRERKEDIPYLVAHFAREYAVGPEPARIPEATMNRLMAHDWPGNVRELQNVILGFISTGQVYLHGAVPCHHHEEAADLKTRMEAHEKHLILTALEKNNWHRVNTAADLNITRNTLFRKITRYGLKPIPK